MASYFLCTDYKLPVRVSRMDGASVLKVVSHEKSSPLPLLVVMYFVVRL